MNNNVFLRSVNAFCERENIATTINPFLNRYKVSVDHSLLQETQ